MNKQFVIQFFLADNREDYVILEKLKWDSMENKDKLDYICIDEDYEEVETTKYRIIDSTTRSLLLGLGLGR